MVVHNVVDEIIQEDLDKMMSSRVDLDGYHEDENFEEV